MKYFSNGMWWHVAQLVEQSNEWFDSWLHIEVFLDKAPKPHSTAIIHCSCPNNSFPCISLCSTFIQIHVYNIE